MAGSVSTVAETLIIFALNAEAIRFSARWGVVREREMGGGVYKLASHP